MNNANDHDYNTISEMLKVLLKHYYWLKVHKYCKNHMKYVAPENVASPGNVIIYGKCRTVSGKCRNLLKTSYTPLPVYVALLTGNVAIIINIKSIKW